MTNEEKTVTAILNYLDRHKVQARIILSFFGFCIAVLTASFSVALILQAKHGCFSDIVGATKDMII